MGKGRKDYIQTLGILLAWLLVYVWLAQPSFSFRLPMGGVASQKRLQEGPGAKTDPSVGQYNVTYVPLLLDLAREIGRFQFTQSGYYIQNDPLPNYPGLDLRWLLFSQSSPLTVPEGFSRPPETIPTDRAVGPTLAVPNVANGKDEPLPNAQVPPSVPQLAVSPLSCEVNQIVNLKPAAQIASPEKIRLAMPEHQLNSLPTLISVDFQGLSAALTGIGNPDRHEERIAIAAHRVSPLVGNVLPVSQTPKGHSTAFMLWTLKPASTSSLIIDGAKDFPSQEESTFKDSYQGTFVACMPGVRFKGIHSRIFELQKGKLLASNSGENLVISTEVAKVILPAGSSAIIDLNESNVLSVIALESSGEATITIQDTSLSDTNKPLSLSRGEELVLSTEDLSSNDVLERDGLVRKPLMRSTHIARNELIMDQILKKERLLNPGDLAGQQRSAVLGLREKIGD